MKTKSINILYKIGLYLTLFLFSSNSYAHHPMDGELPQNFLNGFFSGIGHPIIGFDHLAFILTFGIIVSYYKNKIILPLSFVTLSLFGTLMSINFLLIPLAELIISLSIIIAGLIVINERKINITFPIILALLGGISHGYAFGETVVGIETTPLIAYLIGIASIGFILILGSSYLVTKYYLFSLKPRFIGALFTGVGLTFFLENIEQFF